MAINLHLARTYGDGLYPTDPDDLARTEQWSIWAISEIESYQMAIVVQKFFTPEEKRSERAIESSGKALARPLAVLDAALADRDYLLGDTFTIADLNVSAVMLLLQMIEFDLSPFPNVQRWTGACYARPALAAAQARD
jgi:glutathione S-transferase